MNREEIEKRIIVCEDRAKGYREVGKNFVADKYDNEKYKWEKLLSDLDLLNERKINELLDYKKGYLNLEKASQHLKDKIEKAIEAIKMDLAFCEKVKKLETDTLKLKDINNLIEYDNNLLKILEGDKNGIMDKKSR